jgi:hypothetical protein
MPTLEHGDTHIKIQISHCFLKILSIWQNCLPEIDGNHSSSNVTAVVSS